MALNTLKCNYLTPLHFKGLSTESLSHGCSFFTSLSLWQRHSMQQQLL